MNIFLTRDNVVKVGDLGEARQLEATNEMAQTHTGTQGYMSPEILEGQSYSFKSDIWSIGCVLYFLCSLKLPFEPEEFGTVVYKDHEPISATYSVKVRRLVDMLLAKD